MTTWGNVCNLPRCPGLTYVRSEKRVASCNTNAGSWPPLDSTLCGGRSLAITVCGRPTTWRIDLLNEVFIFGQMVVSYFAYVMCHHHWDLLASNPALLPNKTFAQKWKLHFTSQFFKLNPFSPIFSCLEQLLIYWREYSMGEKGPCWTLAITVFGYPTWISDVCNQCNQGFHFWIDDNLSMSWQVWCVIIAEICWHPMLLCW